MTYSLVCPKCRLQFDYEVTTIPGNTGSQNLVQISLSVQNSQSVENRQSPDVIQFSVMEQSSLNIGFKEFSGWNLQELREKDNVIVSPETIQLAYDLKNESLMVKDIFYLTCPNGHRLQYTLDINRN